MVDISGYNKADVLRVLYDNARVKGNGFLHRKTGLLTNEEAERILSSYKSIDYLNGRVLKVDLTTNAFDPFLYNRDNGAGAAEKAIASLKKL